ncbi:MAG: hypothetical protein DMG06_02640 [Acidobacteria bacterium]|nr:MAG: hypothetical protein DMG06_02640 [Acidobacteriota bacterium]
MSQDITRNPFQVSSRELPQTYSFYLFSRLNARVVAEGLGVREKKRLNRSPGCAFLLRITYQAAFTWLLKPITSLPLPIRALAHKSTCCTQGSSSGKILDGPTP